MVERLLDGGETVRREERRDLVVHIWGRITGGERKCEREKNETGAARV